ncbi:MAG: hypothetical protein ACRDK3_10750 [Actinomycetota bacterium]
MTFGSTVAPCSIKVPPSGPPGSSIGAGGALLNPTRRVAVRYARLAAWLEATLAVLMGIWVNERTIAEAQTRVVSQVAGGDRLRS